MAVSDFTYGQAYFTALGVQHKEQTLDYIFSETSDVCCRGLNVDISTEETDSSIDIISPLIDEAVATLKILGEKKPEFDDTPLTTFLVVGDIKSTKRHTKSLLDCFAHNSPEEYYTPVRDITHRLGDAFSGVRFTYGM
ncbi:hypothetical protein HPULCUR_001138 [Helicostylum pulchrum]|uniref:Uncharacterized protein n=1 Tax=Helicostylum pulchrum TaxID=562976 RepID=A0ABP9XLX3_9FUNG